MAERYAASEAMLDRPGRPSRWAPRPSARASRSIRSACRPISPPAARASKLWDVDGNEYIDFINGLASVTLGYNDPDVTAAVKAQVDHGTIFSLSSPLEAEVAERLAAIVPSAEMVRFGKNGRTPPPARSASRGLYPAATYVLVCGYHGRQDWYIGATARNRGVPNRPAP